MSSTIIRVEDVLKAGGREAVRWTVGGGGGGKRERGRE